MEFVAAGELREVLERSHELVDKLPNQIGDTEFTKMSLEKQVQLLNDICAMAMRTSTLQNAWEQLDQVSASV